MDHDMMFGQTSQLYMYRVLIMGITQPHEGNTETQSPETAKNGHRDVNWHLAPGVPAS
jgi:hypothetical protein